MKKNPVVAVVGATGAVGREMLDTLVRRNFPHAEVRALASSRSAGTKVEFGSKKLTVQELTEDSFNGVDLALFPPAAPLPKSSRLARSSPAAWSWTTPVHGAWIRPSPWSFRKLIRTTFLA